MRLGSIFKALVAILFLLPAVCKGWSPLATILPEDLEPKADLICTGTVLSVSETGIEKDIVYFPNENPRAYPEMVMLAKIKVLHVFKGQAPSEIEFRYWAPQPDKPMFDAPNPVILEQDKRYRFFLKPDQKTGGYVGVLDGQYTGDCAAVEGLWPNERDDGPYLKKEVAYKIAVDYARSNKLKARFSERFLICSPETMEVVNGIGRCEGATWSILLPYSARIVVRGDGTVDVAQSWFKE